MSPGSGRSCAGAAACGTVLCARPMPASPGSGRAQAGAPTCAALRSTAPCAAHPAAPSPRLLLCAPAPRHAQGRAAASATGAPALAVPRAGPPLPWQLHRTAAACSGGGRRQASSSRSTAARCAAFAGSSRNATAQNAPGTYRNAGALGGTTSRTCSEGVAQKADQDRHDLLETAILLRGAKHNGVSGCKWHCRWT